MRYIVTIDYYITADSDKDALLAAEETAKEMRYHFDNQAKVLSVVEQNFASLQSKSVFDGPTAVTQLIRDAIRAKKTSRAELCVLLSCSLPTIKNRFTDHAWTQAEIAFLRSKQLL